MSAAPAAGSGVTVREARAEELECLLAVHRAAFGSDEEAGLVRAILMDESAAPTLSLVAADGDDVLGHILFSQMQLGDDADNSILCPLAVMPEAQARGIGGALIREGLARLAASNAGDDVRAVFVYGDPAYYGRFGFTAAIPQELLPPHPIPVAHLDAWMVRTPDGGALDVAGPVRCCDALDDPAYW